MQVRVKEDSKFKVITSCGGMTFFRNTSTEVDKEFRTEVLNNPYLEIVGDEGLGEPSMSPDLPPQSEVDATDGAIKLAEAEGIDLAEVEGSGANGRITVPDVKALIVEEG